MIARSRRTVRSALLQARDVRIAKIPAARALGEVAAERREMADLRRRETLRRSHNAGIGRCNAWIGRDRSDGGEGANARYAVGTPVHADGVGSRRDIDQRSTRDATAPTL